MKNKKAVKLLATINVLAMLTMLGQPVVKAQQPKEEYLVEINETNFPDNLLRRYMNLVVDSNQNGKIEQDEVQKIKYLKLGEYEGEGELEKFTNLGDEGVVRDFKGIEYLTNLEEMKIAIPTKMTNKESLYKLTNLKSVTMLGGFGKTDLKTFDFSNYRKLNKIQIVQLNNLKKINISKNSNLKSFECWAGGKLNKVDFSKCKKVSNIKIVDTNIKKINIGKNKKLKSITIKNDNSLKKIDISKAGKIKSLKIVNAPKLKKIITSKKRKIKSVIVKGCKNISKKDIRKIKKK